MVKGNTKVKLKGTLGNYPSLFINDEQMLDKELKIHMKRLRDIDREQVMLDYEKGDIHKKVGQIMAKKKLKEMIQDEPSN